MAEQIRMLCPHCKLDSPFRVESSYDFPNRINLYTCCTCGECIDPIILENRRVSRIMAEVGEAAKTKYRKVKE